MNLYISVFSPDLVPLGLINQFTSLIWVSRTQTFGSFTLWCPLIEENSALLKPSNLLNIGGDEIGVIEMIQKITNEQGLSIQVSGRFIESWIERRIIWGQYSKKDLMSNHIRNLVQINAISPDNKARELPGLTLSPTQEPIGPTTGFSVSYGNLWSTILELANSNSAYIRVRANIPDKRLELCVLKGIDRSVEQKEIPPIILSTNLSDILSDEYTLDTTSWCNMALVAGAGEGSDRKLSEINGSAQGLDRRERFVDARDIVDYTETPSGHKPIEDSIYQSMLQERGKSKLLDTPLVESFNANIRTHGAKAYEYGVDYSLGDRVTIQDENLGVQVSTIVSEATQTWDENGYQVSLTLGSSSPTITQLLKKRG